MVYAQAAGSTPRESRRPPPDPPLTFLSLSHLTLCPGGWLHPSGVKKAVARAAADAAQRSRRNLAKGAGRTGSEWEEDYHFHDSSNDGSQVVVVGAYGEVRLLGSFSGDPSSPPRNVNLGLEVFLPPGEAVVAPAECVVIDLVTASSDPGSPNGAASPPQLYGSYIVLQLPPHHWQGRDDGGGAGEGPGDGEEQAEPPPPLQIRISGLDLDPALASAFLSSRRSEGHADIGSGGGEGAPASPPRSALKVGQGARIGTVAGAPPAASKESLPPPLPSSPPPLPPHVRIQAVVVSEHLTMDKVPERCSAAEAGAWLAICPCPAALIGLDPAAVTAPATARVTANATANATTPERQDALASRRRHFARVQEHYFDRPPQIERGWRCHLYDTHGRAYLDMVREVWGEVSPL